MSNGNLPHVDAVPVKRLTFNPGTGTHEVRTPTAKFIKGPIPLGWISRANTLPGKAGAVGVALWFLAGIQRAQKFKLTIDIERIAGCERKAVYSAIKALEQCGLITVQRFPGARPIVILNDCKS